MIRPIFAYLLCLICAACAVTGCQNDASTGPVQMSGDPPPIAGGAHDAHGHGNHGPHGGELTELGKGKFHLELVHDDAAETVAVYILDSAAKESLPISVDPVQLFLVVDGQPRQFELESAAQPTDHEGKSSCFRLTDKELCKALDAKGTKGRVLVTIDGKSYSATLVAGHGHDHAHDHKH